MKDDFFRKLDEIKAFRVESQQNGGVPLLRLVEVAKQDTDQALIVRQFCSVATMVLIALI